MRTGKITINSVEYPITFSIGTQIALDAKKIDLKNFTASVTSTMNVIYEMMVSGRKWAVMNGENAPDLPSFEDVVESLDTDSVIALMTEVTSVMAGERNVKSKPSKK